MEAIAQFWDETEGTGYIKGGFLGFPKSGKTYTATLLAIATRELLAPEAPVALFDTESGASYVKPLIVALTGQQPLVKRSRSFDDLMKFADRIKQVGAIALVDSITHPWREICDSYLEQKNQQLEAKGRPRVTKLTFADWGVLKKTWAQWTDFYLTSPLHLIVCGRAGWEGEMVEDEETGKKEWQRTGVKMKTETEFGFEPSLLVEMQREQDLSGEQTRIYRTATVLGDRFNVIDGQTFEFESKRDPKADLDQVRKAFEPHLRMLTPGAHAPVDVIHKTDMGVDESGDAEWTRERRERTILAEEIQAELVRAYPGQSATEKKAKADLIRLAFDTGSWTKVENLDSRTLRSGLARIKSELARATAPAVEEKSEVVGA